MAEDFPRRRVLHSVKNSQRMGRNYLAHASGDAINAVRPASCVGCVVFLYAAVANVALPQHAAFFLIVS